MNFIAQKGKVKVLFALNIRKGQTTKDLIVNTLQKGQIVEYVGWVEDGELFKNNSKWYKTSDGNYFWSGGVEKVINEEVKFIWPLEKSYKKITTPFSEIWILNPKKRHTGIDIAVPVRERVFAVADCVVEKVGYLDAEKKMAQYVDVRHELGDYCTAYLHIDPAVKIGDKVKTGDVVGYIAKLIGMGPHLHFNVWKGVYKNPITHRGALPLAENAGIVEPKSDPAFPSNFIDPMSLNFC